MSRNYPPTTGGQTHLSKWCGWDPADGVEAILKKPPKISTIVLFAKYT